MGFPPAGGPNVHDTLAPPVLHPRSTARPLGYGTDKRAETACDEATDSAACRLPVAQAETSALAAWSAVGWGDEGTGLTEVVGVVVDDELPEAAAPEGDPDEQAARPNALATPVAAATVRNDTRG